MLITTLASLPDIAQKLGDDRFYHYAVYTLRLVKAVVVHPSASYHCHYCCLNCFRRYFHLAGDTVALTA